jgi:hypothetical protein
MTPASTHPAMLIFFNMIVGYKSRTEERNPQGSGSLSIFAGVCPRQQKSYLTSVV